MNEKDLIEQMVQDTFNSKSDENILRFPQIKASSLRGFHDVNRKCLIIHLEEKYLEIPEFWGPFKHQMGNKVQLSSDCDPYGFVEILKNYFQLDNTEFIIEIENNTNLAISKAA